jgi:hypothetical protein
MSRVPQSENVIVLTLWLQKHKQTKNNTDRVDTDRYIVAAVLLRPEPDSQKPAENLAQTRLGFEPIADQSGL